MAEVLKASSEAARLDVDQIRAVYDDAIVGDGGIERTLKRLNVFADARSRSANQRANIHLVIAHIHWRHGDRAASLAAIETAMDHHETTDGLLLKARLMDVAGDAEAAVPFYERALAATDGKEEAEFIRIRLTMAEARARDVEALLDLAQERDQSFKNRAAIALAILGHPDLANTIYRVVGDDPARAYREHVRLAQWALASGAHPVAQREAWLAFEAAGLQIDARYALALLVESHREEDTLTDLLGGLDGRGAGTAMLDELRVDLLIETQRYDDAVAFYESVAGNGKGVDAASRQRLIKLYDAAGRPDDMIREYRRLMSAEPDVVLWYAGLASHYVGLARQEDALDVWRLFEAANGDRARAVVAAGEEMIGMGFLEEAVAMVERQMAEAGEQVEGLLFLFDARFERGRDDDALAILARLKTLLAPGDNAVRDLADAYERMNRPELALEIMEALETTQDGLGYNERMRMAWLHSLADRKQDALDAWRSLWVSVDNPARRSLAEDQLLLLAAELNTLADIVVQLEEKLFAGDADRNEMDLLVRVYTEVGDTLSATEVIEEFARSARVDPVERLRRLANVYRLHNDYAGYDRVLRQLVNLDPDNESEHVQNLVLNLLAHDLAEESDERYAEIERWLARLHALDATRVSGEFEAGILSLGGFDGEAIESYRRALVRNPENSDNLLLMADRMKSAGRRDEAVTMLQYAAEHAADDNAFVVAVDGIINMIGARSFSQGLTPDLLGIFQWTERVILERITGHDDKFYLYRLLADIAQETGDTEGVFRALENSLPQAGIRRPAILRELVTLATPSAGFGGFNTGRGDPDRQLIHGRRLVGLRQALPPDVYINLGRVLLEKDDIAGAEKALDRIEDITGMIDVDKTKADLLYDAGYPERAAGHYARALSVNRENLSLLARNAMLHEVRGHRAVANEMYLRALGVVLRGEALSRPGRRATSPGSSGVVFRRGPDLGESRDYRTYFGFLVEGLLSTWPQDGDEGEERTRDIEAMFEESLQAVLATGDLGEETVEEFPRLDRTARFVRQVAKTVGDRELAERVDLALEEPFAKDEEEPEASTASSLLTRHLERARRNGNFGHAVQLARLIGDEETLVDLIRDRIADGSYQDGLVNAWLLLDEKAFKRLVTPMASTMKDEAQAFLEFVARTSHLVPAMEATLGRDFISVGDLIELISQPNVSEEPISLGAFGLLRGIWRYVQAKGTLDEQVGFAAAIMRREDEGQVTWYAASPLVADLLSVELSSEQRIALTDALAAMLSKQELSTPAHLANLLTMLIVDIHAANAGLVYTLAGQLQERATTDIDVVAVLRDIYEGSPERAFAGVLELSNARIWQAGIRNARSIHHRFADETERILQAVERGEAVPMAKARLAYDLSYWYFEAPRERLERQVDLASKFAALDPGNSRYRFDRINALIDLGKWSAAGESLHDHYRETPKDEFARAALYFRLVGEGRYRSALEVVTDGAADLRDQAVVDALLENRAGGAGRGMLRRFYSGPMPSGPIRHYPPAMEREIDRLREAANAYAGSTATSGDARSVDENISEEATIETAVESLRAVWRGIRAPVEEGSRRYYMPSAAGLLTLPLDADGPGNVWPKYSPVQLGSISALVTSRPPRRDAPRLLDVVAGMPGVARELESLVPALPEFARRSEPRYYELLADALAAAGLSDARLADLSSRLRGTGIGDHDFTLWMTLRHRADEVLSSHELDAFTKRAVALDDPTPSELLSMARLFAKSGAYADSAEHYSLLAANLLRRGGSGGMRRTVMLQGARTVMVTSAGVRMVSFGSGNVSGPSLSEILAETAEVLPSETAMAFAKKVLAVARPSEDDEAFGAIFDAFVLKTLGLVAPPGDVLSRAAEISPTATAVEAPLDTWAVPKMLELARAHAIAGNRPEALRLLRRFAVSKERDAATSFDFLDEDQTRRANALGTLANTFGLPLVSLRFGPQTPMSGFVNGRERIFPADSDHVWPGAADWMRTAAEAIRDWLNDDVDPAGVREMLVVLARQLHAAGEDESAGKIVKVLGTSLDAQAGVDPVELRNLALLAFRVDSPLPADLAVVVMAGGTLTARQEADLVRELADHDAVGALRAGRAADRGDKLPLMRELHTVAVGVEDVAYAADLATRIELAETAYRELGSPTISESGDGATVP